MTGFDQDRRLAAARPALALVSRLLPRRQGQLACLQFKVGRARHTLRMNGLGRPHGEAFCATGRSQLKPACRVQYHSNTSL